MAGYFAALAVIFAGGIIWLEINLPKLAGLTTGILEWCSGLVSMCLAYNGLLKAALLWSAASLIAAGILYSLFRNLPGLLRARRAVRNIPGIVGRRGRGSVFLIRDESVRTAFTHGMLRPRVYVTTGLIKDLTRDELRSVILHEAHHRRSYDPLKLFIATLIRDAFFYLPMGGWLAERHTEGKETAADRSVVERTGDPLTLAGAIVKVAVSGGGAGLGLSAPASISGSGPVEKRVRRLVEGVTPGRRGPGIKNLSRSVVTAAFLAVSLILPVTSSAYDPGRCDMDHCSVHMTELGKDCKTHCKISGHKA